MMKPETVSSSQLRLQYLFALATLINDEPASEPGGTTTVRSPCGRNLDLRVPTASVAAASIG
jgi:hypothetical protein